MQNPTTTTPTTRPLAPFRPLGELAPRASTESAEAYGMRALLYVTAEGRTMPVDTEGLQLAAHVFRLAVSNPTLTPTGAERLAEVGRLITGALARRALLDAQEAPAAAQAPARAAGDDRPDVGPMAPLVPVPPPQRPPSAALAPRQAPRQAPPVRIAPVAAPLAAGDLF